MQNTGGEAATDVAANASGGFSITADDCPSTLEPAESCTLTLRAPTTQLGPLGGELAVEYTNASGDDVATVALTTEVTGSTGELVPDGGFETCDEGWAAIAGNWDCGATDIDGITSYAGASFLGGATGANNTVLTYRSDIDASEFASAIETGETMVDFSAFARVYSTDDNEHRIRVVYLDAANDVISTTGTNFQSFTSWTEFAFSEAAPVDTATVRINLQCQKTGGSRCDAYFDGVSLSVRYDGA